MKPRIAPLPLFAVLCLLAFSAIAATPPAILRNPWTTNLAGVPIFGTNDLSIRNSTGTNWQFYGATPNTVARLFDATNAAAGLTNGIAQANSNLFILKLNGSGTNLNLYPLNANSAPLTVSSNGGGTAFLISSNGNAGFGIGSNPTNNLIVENTGVVSVAISASDTGTFGAFKTVLSLVGKDTSGNKREQARISSSPGATTSGAGQLLFSVLGTNLLLNNRLIIERS